MKTTLALLFILHTNITYASFNRFWVGYKKDSVTTVDFLNGLNSTFFKETINLSKDRGLVSYQPYVTQMKYNVPDELALVIYESEEQYKSIRSTPEGQKYSDLHWDYFAKENSKSTVTKIFTKDLVEGFAYELHPNFKDWQSSTTYVAIYKIPSSKSLSQLSAHFLKLNNDTNIGNSYLLIMKDWIIEYRLQKDGLKNYSPLPLEIIELKQLQSHSLETVKTVGFGEGVNFKFKTKEF